MAQMTLYDRILGGLLGGAIGDAMGTPSEGLDWRTIEQRLGWIDDFSGDGTDDTVMKRLLIESLVRTDGYATLDDWAQVWLDGWDEIFGSKVNKFFISVLHTAQKLRHYQTPRLAALGNMPSSSSAMCISPVGMANAARPELAALQAYNLAGLIHVHDVGFCQDGAAAMAAAVAAAFLPGASAQTTIDAALKAIVPLSGREMSTRIREMLTLAVESVTYECFRSALYEQADHFFCEIICDSRETIPIALSCLQLADGDLVKTVTYAANLGRDADTTATMAGAVAGVLVGVQSIPSPWRAKIDAASPGANEAMARQLETVARIKAQRDADSLACFAALVVEEEREGS